MTFKKTFYGIPLAYNMVSAGCEILIWGIQNYSGASFCFKYFQKLHLTTVDFFPKIFLILYPSLENTPISVALVHLAFFLSIMRVFLSVFVQRNPTLRKIFRLILADSTNFWVNELLFQWIFKKSLILVEGHLNPGLFNPKLQPRTFQSQTFQPWIFEPWG